MDSNDLLETSRMPIMSHLHELRKRLIVCAVSYFVAVIACYFFAAELFAILKAPVAEALKAHSGSSLAIRSLSEGFMVELKVAAIAGVFAASPIFFYQTWKFVAPGLYRHERRLAVPVVLAATSLFLCGAAFGFFIVFPYVFGFFLSYADDGVTAMLSIEDYLSFAANMLGGFGLVFELPLVIFVLSYLGIVDHRTLARVRRYVIVINFVVAAVITPPDVVSQVFVAVPLIVLYELGIFLAWLVHRKRRTDEEVEAAKTQP